MSLRSVSLGVAAGLMLAASAAFLLLGRAAVDLTAAQSKDGSVIELVFSYGSEKQQWMEEVTAQFNDAKNKIADGRVIRVKLVALGSGECMAALIDPEEWRRTADPKLDPVKDKGKENLRLPPVAAAGAHITSPASHPFLVLAAAEAQAKGDQPPVDLAKTKSVVTSPVVIAMWKPMAQALGWPENPIGWRQVFNLAAAPEGWSSLKQPQWGRFKFGHTHPDLSNSGLIAVIAETYAGANKTGKNGQELTVADVKKQDVRDFVAQIEQSVIFYGQSTGFFGRQLVEGGPSLLSAAVLYEDQVIKANQDHRSGKKQMEAEMVAVYPSEGTFWSDHPAGKVNRPWVTDAHKEAADAFLNYLLAKPQQERAMHYGFRPGQENVKLDKTVFSDQNGVDPLQPKVELSVPEADVMKAIKDMWKEVKKPIRAVLVIDTSLSMKRNQKMLKAKEGAAQFVKRFGPRDELSILAFSDKATWVLPDDGAPLRMDQNGTKRAATTIENLIADGQTALYDATGLAFDKIATEHEQGKARSQATAIILLTDGVDEGSRPDKRGSELTLDKLLDRIKFNPERSATRVFTIAYGEDADKAVLKKIADTTRGFQYDGTPANISKVFKQIYEEQ